MMDGSPVWWSRQRKINSLFSCVNLIRSPCLIKCMLHLVLRWSLGDASFPGLFLQLSFYVWDGFVCTDNWLTYHQKGIFVSRPSCCVAVWPIPAFTWQRTESVKSTSSWSMTAVSCCQQLATNWSVAKRLWRSTGVLQRCIPSTGVTRYPAMYQTSSAETWKEP